MKPEKHAERRAARLRDLIKRAGICMHGEWGWGEGLAADLGVATRTIRRWVTGVSIPPAGIEERLLELMTARITRLRNLSESLREAAAASGEGAPGGPDAVEGHRGPEGESQRAR